MSVQTAPHSPQARSSSAPSTTALASNAAAIQEVFGGGATLEQVYARLEARQDVWAEATRALLAKYAACASLKWCSGFDGGCGCC